MKEGVGYPPQPPPLSPAGVGVSLPNISNRTIWELKPEQTDSRRGSKAAGFPYSGPVPQAVSVTYPRVPAGGRKIGGGV